MKLKKSKLPKNPSPKKPKKQAVEVVEPVKKVKVLSPVAKAKKEFYVNPKEFTDELQKYYETDIITDNLALMIRNIAYGLAHASNFINYTFKEEAIGDSLINMFSALKQKKYKFDKGFNPFSYFNSIAFNCWRSRIKKEKRMRDTLAAYQEEVYSVIGPQVGVDDPTNPLNKHAN
ncbi:MAG: hypothetical protein EBR30_00690 [Cytophagia bacterium]|jgi:hypothetical protein|nr:hypothetical protein [Cytophagia bacterium]